MPADLGKYIGLPFLEGGRNANGLDCWGLVCLFYKNERGIDLNEETSYQIKNKKSCQVFANETKENFQRVKKPRFGDLVSLTISGFEAHVAIYIGNGMILHSWNKTNSIYENIKPVWDKRIAGYYRHKGFSDA